MKIFPLLLMILIFGCSEKTKKIESEQTGNQLEKKPQVKDTLLQGINKTADSVNIPVGTNDKVYSNNRFRNVTVTKSGIDTYRIKGEAQIFEASFSWVVEDGHNELKKGHQMTDAGAPEWGHFDFTITAKKQRANSVLHLILFESSAKDGSRQFELSILLG